MCVKIMRLTVIHPELSQNHGSSILQLKKNHIAEKQGA